MPDDHRIEPRAMVYNQEFHQKMKSKWKPIQSELESLTEKMSVAYHETVTKFVRSLGATEENAFRWRFVSRQGYHDQTEVYQFSGGDDVNAFDPHDPDWHLVGLINRTCDAGKWSVLCTPVRNH